MISKYIFEKIIAKLNENNKMNPFITSKRRCFSQEEHKYLVFKCKNCSLYLPYQGIDYYATREFEYANAKKSTFCLRCCVIRYWIHLFQKTAFLKRTCNFAILKQSLSKLFHSMICQEHFLPSSKYTIRFKFILIIC